MVDLTAISGSLQEPPRFERNCCGRRRRFRISPLADATLGAVALAERRLRKRVRELPSRWANCSSEP
jgi:hypothetical protein